MGGVLKKNTTEEVNERKKPEEKKKKLREKQRRSTDLNCNIFQFSLVANTKPCDIESVCFCP